MTNVKIQISNKCQMSRKPNKLGNYKDEIITKRTSLSGLTG